MTATLPTRQEIAVWYEYLARTNVWSEVDRRRVLTACSALLDIADMYTPTPTYVLEAVDRIRSTIDTLGAMQVEWSELQEIVPGEGDVVERVNNALDGRDDAVENLKSQLALAIHNGKAECARAELYFERLRRAEQERDQWKGLAEDRLQLWIDAKRAWCPNCGYVRDSEEWQCPTCDGRVFESSEHYRLHARLGQVEAERDEARRDRTLIEQALSLLERERSARGRTFEKVWAGKQAQGYQYGPDALENVHFGWNLAQVALGVELGRAAHCDEAHNELKRLQSGIDETFGSEYADDDESPVDIAFEIFDRCLRAEAERERADEQHGRLERQLDMAKELCNDLRGYTRDWEWKYGAEWASEYAAAFGEPWKDPGR